MGVANNIKKGTKVAKSLIKKNPLMWKVKFIAGGILLGLFLLVFLTCSAYIFLQSAKDYIKNMFADAFPAATDTSQTGGATSTVEAAKKIHSAIEGGKYSFGTDNTCETLSESEAAGKTIIDGATYVDWVLHEIGKNINTRNCPELKAELDSASFVEKIDSQEKAKAGDIVLFENQIQIYAGNERWKRLMVYCRIHRCYKKSSSF